MSQLIFSQLAKSNDPGLYKSTDDTNQELTLYYLAATVPDSNEDLDFSQVWAKQIGYLFFLPSTIEISDASKLADSIKDKIGKPSAGVMLISWISSLSSSEEITVDFSFSISFSGSGGVPKINTEVTVNLLTLNMFFPSGINLTTDTSSATPVFSIQSPLSGTNPIKINGVYTSLEVSNEESVDIPLTGSHIGVLSFASEWDKGSFYGLFTPNNAPINDDAPPSGEIRFQYKGSSDFLGFRYPAFIGQSRSTSPSDSIFLKISFDPFNLLDGNRSRFAFNLDEFTPSIPLPTADSLRNNSGSSLYMKPLSDPSDSSNDLMVAGFAMGNRPNENDGNKSIPYLVPIGNYGIESTEDDPADTGVNKIMCGLVGTEFLLSAEGDILEFTNQAHSLATGYDPSSNTNTDDLDDTYTTSWLRLIPGPNSGKVFTGPIKESYCVQAPDSVYYTPGETEDFSIATGVRLASLEDTSQTKPFPMVPYGSVYYSKDKFKVPNDADSSVLTSFEYDVLSTKRRSIINPDLCNGPIFFNSANGDPLNGGFVRSPIGLLAELNAENEFPDTPTGTLKRILLAKSPVNDTQFMQFTAEPSPYCKDNDTPPTVVSPVLSNALMHNSVFLVANQNAGDLKNLGGFDNKLQLGEFTYEVNLSGKYLDTKSPNGDPLATVMIFKFSTTQSVEDLAKNTNAWTNTDDFIGGLTVDEVATQIKNSITDAQNKVDNNPSAKVYFQDFLNKMKDSKWTGMIVLNCELDYQALPTDIQVLLGGIDGELIAHHFGITVNQVKSKTEDPTTLEIDNSSLFSLIYYDKEYEPIDPVKEPKIKNFKFQVTKLNVLYTNSVMTQFQSQIAMTIKELYGDEVKLKQGGPKDKLEEEDAMLIDGVYLKDGASGHIVFDSTTPRYFEFNNDNTGFRVLDNVVITDATLIPISSTDNGSGTTVVKAAFRLNGEFGFNPDVSTNGSKVDLFSYAINSIADPTTTTLNFSNNSLDWDTNIVGQKADIQYPIVPDLNNLKLDTNATQPREGSLVSTFPLKLVDFNWSPNGLSADAIGAKQITGDPSLSVTLGQGNAPNFSLVFNLNMGNLGMLTSGTALQSTVYLGWSSVGDDTSKGNDMSLLFVPPAEFSSGNEGFKLQGVVDTVYGELILNRLPVDDDSPLLFVLSLTNIQFSILSINLLPGLTDGQKPRVLTLFGDPDKKGNNLSWFLSNPNKRSAPVDIDIVYPQAGIMNGISIKSDFTGTQVISDAISELEGVIYSSDVEVIQDIKSGVSDEGFAYDPKAGVLFFIDLQFVAFTFQMLLADPSFYGGLLKIGEQKEGTFLEKWSDLEIELVYRKISDGLGVVSVHFTIPEAFRTIPNAEAPTSFTFPSFGLNVYTNGDWKIEVGWPFPSDDNAKISFVLYGVPVFVGIGLYLAKLRGADVPGTFPESFKLIWMFGLGLSFGIEKEYPVKEKPKDGEKEEEKPKGVISASFTLYIWASFQGMLVSENGSITDNGVDYQWWTTTLGVNLNIEGKVDLKIISVALEVEATIYITFALETGHQTVVEVGADFSVKLTIKILFIKIHISFSHHFDLAHWTWGSGPEALASGPTPCKLPQYQGQPGCTDSAGEIVHAPAPMMMAKEEPLILDVTPMVGAAAKTTAKDAAPTPITVYYLLQPATATEDDGADWNPYAVSSLVIQMDTSNNGSNTTNTTTQFSALLSVLANYIVTLIPANTGTDLASILNAMSVVVHSDEFFDESDSFLATDVVFTIDKSSSLISETDSYAVLPMLSQCKITYNGADTSLNAPTVPSDYVKAVQDYFDQYMVSNDPDNMELSVQVNEEISVEEMLVKDYFTMLAQQLVYELGNTLSATTPPTDLEGALAMANNSNIAGFVSQFMLQGLRLPKFDGSTINISNDDWVGIYDLAGAQTELVKDDKGDYITTFTLSLADSSASSYIKFAGADNPTSISEDFPVDQILDAAPSTSWLNQPGGGVSILNPLAASQKTFNLQQPKTYNDGTGTSSLFPLPNAMQKELEQLGALKLDLSLISDSSAGSSQDSNVGTAVNGTPALFVPITINKVALPDSNTSDTYYKDTYAIKGTDQFTRELLELLLKQFDSSSTLSLLINTGKNEYVAPDDTDNIVLVKNNLSTDAEPEDFSTQDLRASQLETESIGPVLATLSDVENFLRLIWEESVVRTAGYYLHLEKIPDGAFTGESATIALLIGDGSTASSEITLKNYHNLIDINQSLDKGALAAAVKTSAGDAIQVYQPNYGPGSTGFTVKWLNANPEPDISNTGDYITSLYRTVQFIIDNISNTAAPSDGYYWSKPNAAKREPGTETGKDNWIFRQTIPAYQFIDNTNPYAAIGKDVSLRIRVLDMYGNALPKNDIKDETTTIVYNDPINTFNQLQWLKVAYCVDSKSGTPVLEIDFNFDTDTVQEVIKSGSDDGKSQVQQALSEFNKAIGQYSDSNASLSIQTSLSGNTFTKDGNNDGTLLKTSVVNYLTSVAVYLQDVLEGKTIVDPGTKVLSLNLDFDFVKGIKDTVFVVDVVVTISRSNTTTEVTDLLPSVGSVSIPIVPYVIPGSGDDTKNTPSLAAFANQFELTYDGFDGANGQLKIGTGNDFSNGLQNAQENAIWAMKWSVPNGMAVSIKDGTRPSFYAPVPLATSLITRSEDVILYNSTWNGSSSDIDKTIQVNFANIDMNIWASQFLSTFHDFVTPEMAAAIAKLDDTTYTSLMSNKNVLAEAIANTIDLIIEPTEGSGIKLDSDFESAKERMLQSLLASLDNDYGTSALVQMPTDVSIVGQVEPGIDDEYPPTLFGKISATGDKSNVDANDKTPYTVSNAYLPLVDETDKGKSQYLNFTVAAEHPEDQSDLNLDLLYDIGFINHQFESSEEKYGYVPSSWMTVVLPERLVNGAQPALLQVPMNNVDIPIPLRTFPASPSFNSQTATGKESDQSYNGSQSKDTPPSIKDFIDWTYTVQVSRPKAAQDDLHLEISYNENIDGDTTTSFFKAALLGDGRPAPTDLFEALARFSYEYPEIEPYLDKIPDAAFNGTDEDVAKAALSRMTELIDGVANTWGTWTNPSAARKDMRFAELAGGTNTTTITPIDQTYVLNFSDEGKTITVTGVGYTAGDKLPLTDLPYPKITGYNSDLKPVDNVVTYTATDDAPSFLELSFEGLNIGTHQSGITRAYVERNADIAPDGFITNEKFIFHTPVVSFKTPIVPLIEDMMPITLPDADTLTEVITQFFNDFLGDDPAKSVVKELQFTLEVGSQFLIAKNAANPDNQTLLSTTPILFSQTAVATPSNITGTPPTQLDQYVQSLVSQITAWHNDINHENGNPTQMLSLSFTLFADVSESKLPLLRLGQLEIVPKTNDDNWWS